MFILAEYLCFSSVGINFSKMWQKKIVYRFAKAQIVYRVAKAQIVYRVAKAQIVYRFIDILDISE